MHDADATDKCIWRVSSGSSVRCDAKVRKKPAIYVQAPCGSSFSDIHNFSEEDCQADQWEKPFENLVVLHQMHFASVNRTLSASVRLSLVITLVRAVLFPCTFDSVLDCTVTEEKRTICIHPELRFPLICTIHATITTQAILSIRPYGSV